MLKPIFLHGGIGEAGMEKYNCPVPVYRYIYIGYIHTYILYTYNVTYLDGPLKLFFILTNWCKKAHGMCYPVCGMVHIKDSLQEAVGFLSRYQWSFTT